MDQVIDFLKKPYLNNEVWRYAGLLLSIFAGLAAGRIARFILEQAANRMKRGDEEQLPGLLCRCLGRPVTFLGFALGVRFGLALLKFSEGSELNGMRTTVGNVLFAVAIGYSIYKLVDILDYYLMSWARGTETKLDDMLVPLVRKSVRITVVIIVVVFVVEQVAGENFTTILAGLGVGGLAVALAAQDTVKNFFGSVMILFDKPFQVGDRIVLHGHDGPVEEVGFRSTKIRTLDGHLVTVPNSVVANEAIQNIGKRPYIKRVMNVTITYDTPKEKIVRAVEILRELLDNHEGMNPDFPPRVYFNEFNSDSLNILVIYWYHPPEYWDFLAFNETLCLQIFERFDAEGIEFAFPTQTLYLANDEKRQLAVRLLKEDGASVGT